MNTKRDVVLKPATTEQLEIYNTNFELVRILVIRALAGTGKTSVLIQLALENPHVKYLYIALNNSIVKDVENECKKVGIKNVKCKTIHSLAYESSSLYRNNRTIQNIKPEFITEYLNEKDRFKSFEIIKMINEYCEQTKSFKDFSDMIIDNAVTNNYSNNIPSLKSILKSVQILLNGFESGSINFITHGLYLKHFIDNQSAVPEDCIMIDESQDLNDAMFSFVESQIDFGIKNIISVGDQNQSVYGFLNSRDIMKILKEKYGGVVKTLTRSFRFPPHSEMEIFANNFLKLRGETIYGAALHKDMNIRNIGYIARTNMQVLNQAVNLIKEGKDFHLVGGIKSIDFNTILDIWYLSNIDSTPQNESKIKSPIVRGFSNKGELKRWAVEHGHVEFISACSAVDQMYIWIGDKELSSIMKNIGMDKLKIPFPKKISNLIDQNNKKKSHRILSTFHKSKGLGMDKVVILSQGILDKDKIVVPYGLLQDYNLNTPKKIKAVDRLFKSRDGQIGYLLKSDPKQNMLFDEYNLMYVAVTRAKKEMEVKDKRLVSSANLVVSLFDAFSHNETVFITHDNMDIECYVAHAYINSEIQNLKYFIPKSVATEFLSGIQSRD